MKKLLVAAALLLLTTSFGQEPEREELEAKPLTKTVSGYLNSTSIKATTFVLDVPGKGSVPVDFSEATVTWLSKEADLAKLPNRSTLRITGSMKGKTFAAEKILVTFVRSKLVKPAGTKPVTVRPDDPKPRGKTPTRRKRR